VAALTIKQEAFAQKYVETGNASEAYRQAYDAGGMKPATINVKACELLANGKVAARVAELRGKVETVHGVTVASLIAELEEARQVAKVREQGAAKVQATMGKAKLAGLDKEGEKSGDDLSKAIQNLIDKLPA
jgi:phage terminase small subunit